MQTRPPISRRDKPRILLCALETYAKIGGLQNFNRRVITNLAARALERGESLPLAVLSGDGSVALPRIEGIAISGYDRRVDVLRRVIWAAVTEADVFMIGHVNLLPVAVLVRCLRPRMPILLFVHGDEVWNVAIHRSKRWYEPFLLRALTRVASVSQFTIDVMAREFDVPLPKFRLLPNAVDPLPVSRGDASEASHQRDPFTILTVSRLGVGDREKYVDKVIEAVARLKKILPEVRYEIVGDGVLRSELEALAKDLGVDDVVRFRGRVDDAELHQAYARAAVFAMPSSKEGFGIVYLEAWQRGLPVVCSSEGAAKEVVSDGIDGFVVDPKDISALADKLHLLLSKPELAKSFGENGRRKVEEKYLNPAFRANLDRIIDEIRQL